jgi:MFS family permease
VFGAAMLVFSLSPGLVSSFPLAVLIGFTSIIFMTSSTAIVQVLAAPQYRGRVLAIQSMVFLGSTPIGGPIVGWVADAAGPRVAVLIGAAGCLAAAVYGARALGVSRRGPVDQRRVEEAVFEDESVALAD